MKLFPLALITTTIGAAPAVAQEVPCRPSLEAVEKAIVTRTPELRAVMPDHDRIIARRIDIVDADGTPEADL